MIQAPLESMKRVSNGFEIFARKAQQEAAAVRPTDVTRPVPTIATGVELMARAPGPPSRAAVQPSTWGRRSRCARAAATTRVPSCRPPLVQSRATPFAEALPDAKPP